VADVLGEHEIEHPAKSYGGLSCVKRLTRRRETSRESERIKKQVPARSRATRRKRTAAMPTRGSRSGFRDVQGAGGLRTGAVAIIKALLRVWLRLFDAELELPPKDDKSAIDYLIGAVGGLLLSTIAYAVYVVVTHYL
jgi:hypothetical protein